MHLSKLTIASGLFVLAAGCGGSASNGKSADAYEGTGNAPASDAAASKQSECGEVEKKLTQLDEAGKGAKKVTSKSGSQISQQITEPDQATGHSHRR